MIQVDFLFEHQKGLTIYFVIDGRREVIDLRDFLSCIVDVANKIDGPEIILQSFSALDKDETGLISIEEFRHVMTNLGDTLSNEEVKIYC